MHLPGSAFLFAHSMAKRKAKTDTSDPLIPAANLVDELPVALANKARLENIPEEKRHSTRVYADTSSAEQISVDKHVDKLKYKIAYTAHKLADDLATEASRRNKKDYNYVKGLVWSLGVLFDKLAAGQSEAVQIRIPTKLLDNVKIIIAAQAEKRSAPKDITPTVLDTQSNPVPDKSTG